MSHKICPICDTPAARNATICSACGASLSAQAVVVNGDADSKSPEYDYHHGETDLFEGNLNWRGSAYIFTGMLVLAAFLCFTSVFLAGAGLFRLMDAESDGGNNGAIATLPVVDVTKTATPVIELPTVTPAPPTRTPSPTPGPTDTPAPCMQQVQPGDSLIAIVSRCGHRDLAVLNVVLELNNLDSPEALQSGQNITVPWPTPTFDPNSVPETSGETGEGDAGAEGDASGDGANAAAVANAAEVDEYGFAPLPTATLQPGVMWHTVRSGENIIVVAYQYGANVKILSELNPEVTFAQCDFGLETGGAQCSVSLREGQMLRVPAPTPTPTLSPTPSGSETPTPTATPTFNAPSAQSPGHLAVFQRSDFVTLRWVASGTLSPGQVYFVRVEDTNTGQVYQAETTDLFFVIPLEWQGRDGVRHNYSWTVSVIDTGNPNNPYFITEPRTFVWESVGEDG